MVNHKMVQLTFHIVKFVLSMSKQYGLKNHISLYTDKTLSVCVHRDMKC
jgi:hypothetical protein